MSINKIVLLSEKLKELNSFDKIIVGYSGGPDSQVLAELLVEAVDKSKIVLVHINHNYSPNANGWEKFCREKAEMMGVEFDAHNFYWDRDGNFESKARDFRYSAFQSHCVTGNNAILTGHHADDQVETLLLSIIRGAGIDGLSCMPEIKEIKTDTEEVVIKHIRPMLDVKKEVLVDYLDSNNIEYVFDESNESDDYSRNFLRNNVIPLIESNFGSITGRVLKTVNNIQTARNELDELSADYRFDMAGSASNIIRIGYINSSTDRSSKNSLVYENTKNILKTGYGRKNLINQLKENYGIALTHKTLDEVEKTLLNSGLGGEARVKFGNHYFLVAKGEFCIVNVDFYHNDDLNLTYGKFKPKNNEYVILKSNDEDGSKPVRWSKFCEYNNIPAWIKRKMTASSGKGTVDNPLVLDLDNKHLLGFTTQDTFIRLIHLSINA